ncbi:OLC1v1029741C1 [Oldenlandia corymbosa var. corymbosa]|uniref:OLC1v1029741C1 n=1 Tax=Oldenlandia corymbosa var. corymbosa TaxID=529605 RepID=A0AAV1CG02_OLDCO|nr:OLC1v1029741C1 [Oldenlandia corymbosa var. corymbosa]
MESEKPSEESGPPQARRSAADLHQQVHEESSATPTSEQEEEESSSISKQSEDSGKPAPVTQGKEILKAIEVVERDSVAIAQSFTSLFASLRLALSQVTSTSVDHMSCFSDAAGRLQESALDAATKGNRYINSCLRLNEEMKGIDNLASQLYPFLTSI